MVVSAILVINVIFSKSQGLSEVAISFSSTQPSFFERSTYDLNKKHG